MSAFELMRSRAWGAAPLWLLGPVAVLAAAGLASRSGPSEQPPRSARIEHRPFDVYLSERVVFEADAVAAVASSLPSNQARVVYLAPEGSLVAPGDVLARFDPAPFVDSLGLAQDELEDAKAQLARARTELEIRASELDAGIEETKRQLASARLARRRLVEVEIPAERLAAREELEAAGLELEKALEALAMTSELESRGYASRDERRAAQQNAQQAEQRAAAREAALALLERVEFTTAIEQADLDVEQRRRDLERREADRPRQLTVAHGTVERLESRVKQLNVRIHQAREHVDATVIAAPVAGIVSYPQLAFGNEQRKVQIGDVVWQRQTFLVLPDLGSLVARADVREVDVGALASGQPVRLEAAAFGDLDLAGEVLSVGTVAAGDDGRHRFEVRIGLTSYDARLRPGMTGRATILTRRYEHAAVVPVDAVFYEQGRPVVYVPDGGQWIARPVELGGSDGVFVAVASAIEGVAHVALDRPAGAR